MTRGQKLTAVDLFAGAGGLSLGARSAGLSIPVAVELDSEIAATYRMNLPGVTVIERDIRELTGSEILDFTPGRHIDLLMGCAPCQGFCSLTPKSASEDPRNRLVLEMARLVEETRPDAVLMENVSGLALRGRNLLMAFVRRLRSAGYTVAWHIVQMADYGVPQYRRRLVLLAGKGFSITLPMPTHDRRSGNRVDRRPWKTIRDAIYQERPPLTFTRARARGGPRVSNWHVVRDLKPETRARLSAARPGGMRHEMNEELLPECHHGGYTGFRNVYMRMAWDKVSPTITGGCTTPAKGRFGHPDRRRTTISVREAALIQTFPRSFRFASDKIDLVCEMIGNAVPPVFAEQVIATVSKAIRGSRGRRRNRSK